jgi:hypothetical protein
MKLIPVPKLTFSFTKSTRAVKLIYWSAGSTRAGKRILMNVIGARLIPEVLRRYSLTLSSATSIPEVRQGGGASIRFRESCEPGMISGSDLCKSLNVKQFSPEMMRDSALIR